MAPPRPDLQRLLEEAPFVHSLAHALVADEADDVVQQAFVQALVGQPRGLAEPRRWLARVVRNLALDQRRRGRRRRARQHEAARRLQELRGLVPSSVELLEQEEQRRALVAAVDALPDAQRTVVLLRYYEGMPPRRIAGELGVPTKAVYNRLHAALQSLRARLDRAHGGQRRAWLLPLVPFAARPRLLPWREVLSESAASGPRAATTATRTISIGMIAMTTKSKLVAAGAAVLTIALAWVAWPTGRRPEPEPPARATAADHAAVQAPLPAAQAAGAGAEPVRETADAAPEPAPVAATLAVRVEYPDEPRAGAGLPVTVYRRGGDFRVGARHATTDGDGRATFPGLEPGSYVARLQHREVFARVELASGQVTEHVLPIPQGFLLTGLVVDADGVPVGGALIEVGRAAMSGTDVEVATTSAADGTFAIRHCARHCAVGARARGFASSPLQYVDGGPGSERSVHLELREPGGVVAGVVVRADGTPLPDAVVCVGEGRTSSLRTTPMGAPPVPALVRTGADGRFEAIGVPAGTQPLQARAAGFAPWSGTCEVNAGLTAGAHIVMTPGVRCEGKVRTADGEPAGDVRVTAGEDGTFAELVRRTGTDGSFTMDGLPAGVVEIAAWRNALGRGRTRIEGRPGETVSCTIELGKGLVLRGRVLDADDEPVGDVGIHCHSADGRWVDWTRTGADGRFEVDNCPAGKRLHLRASARDRLPVDRDDVDPAAGELLLRMPRGTAPHARITGRVMMPDGRTTTDVEVEARCRDPHLSHSAEWSDDGAFAIEVPAGTWTLRCEHPDHATAIAGPRELHAGEIWDQGVIVLARGGRVIPRAKAVANTAGTPSYLVFTADERFVCALYTPDPPLRSELLAPGDYLLMVRGGEIAARVVPFSIRDGEDTEVEVRVARGVRQEVRFAAAPGEDPPRFVPFVVRRDGELVTLSSMGGESLTGEIWLEPGTYTLATGDLVAGESESGTRTAFPVGATEGPPLRVVSR